jgi:hypothetical protein
MKQPFPVVNLSDTSGSKSLYPTLKELIDDGRIEPGDNVLSLHTPVCGHKDMLCTLE